MVMHNRHTKIDMLITAENRTFGVAITSENRIAAITAENHTFGVAIMHNHITFQKLTLVVLA